MMPLNTMLNHAFRVVLTFVALLAGQLLAGMVLTFAPASNVDPGPINAGSALLLVNAIQAIFLSALAARLRLSVVRKALLLFALIFLVETLLSMVEAYFFRAFLGLGEGFFRNMAVQGALHAATGSSAAALLWRRPAEGRALPMRPLARSVPQSIALYILCYSIAGYFIAWQNEAVRAFYADGLGIDNALLFSLQLARGAVWTGLAIALLSNLSGTRLYCGFVIGCGFAAFMGLGLLYPSEIMPWAVRRVHLIELVSSNFLFGLVVSLVIARSSDQVS